MDAGLLDGKAAVTITVNGARVLTTDIRAEIKPATVPRSIGARTSTIASAPFYSATGTMTATTMTHRGVTRSTAPSNPSSTPVTSAAGTTDAFNPGWSLRPECLRDRDEGHAPFSEYRSAEIWMTVRQSF